MGFVELDRFSDLIHIIIRLLQTDWLRGITHLPRAIRHLWRGGKTVGIFEVLDYSATLELLDTKGKTAVYHKRQRVRFLQDNIIAYQDKAWGDGDIFHHYRVSPGVAVDRYREGYRYRVLISLRETKYKGDVEEFLIERTIRNGFTQSVEDFQTDVDYKFHYLEMAVIFPIGRFPRKLWLIEKNATRTTALGAEYLRVLPDGRQKVSWSKQKPRLFEAYILRWEW